MAALDELAREGLAPPTAVREEALAFQVDHEAEAEFRQQCTLAEARSALESR